MDQVLPHDDSVDRFARERIIIQNKDEANAFADIFFRRKETHTKNQINALECLCSVCLHDSFSVFGIQIKRL